MSLNETNPGSTRRFKGLLRRMRRNEDGVAALEFAWLAPVMIMLYVGAVELHFALSASRRVTDLASAAADLVAQTSDITSGMDKIFDAAALYLEPFGTDTLKITVTSICHDYNDNGRVDWSANYEKGGVHTYSHGQSIDLPSDEGGTPLLTTRGSSLVLAEVEYTYIRPHGWFVTNDKFADHYYLRPRLTQTASVINRDAGGAELGCAAPEFRS